MDVGILIADKENLSLRFDQMGQMGFTSCQLYCEPMTDEHARVIQDKTREYAMRITCMVLPMVGYHSYAYPEMYATLGLVPPSLRHARMEGFRQGALYAHQLGITDVLTHIGYIGDNPYDRDFLEIQYLLAHFARELEGRAQRLLMETGEILPATWIQLRKHIAQENIFVNFDPCNLLNNGRANPNDALSMLLPWVRGFHAKDGTYPIGLAPKGLETRMGEGQVDFPALIRILKEGGFDGSLTIERELNDGDALEDVRRAKAYLEGLL